MNCSIESIGIKLPEEKLSSKEIARQLHIYPDIKLELMTGIKQRSICTGDENALSLAMDAVTDCFRYSAIRASAIEMIIFSGISREVELNKFYFEPSVSAMIKKRIGAEKAIHFDLTNACAGMLSSIYVADLYIEAGIVSNCLVVSGEFISSICTNAIKNIKLPSSRELASLTIGDGGAAVILEKAEKPQLIEALNIQSYPEHSNLCHAQLSPKYVGAQMFTRMKELQKAALDKSIEFVEHSLKKVNLEFSQIDYMIPHQTAKRAIKLGENLFTQHFNHQLKEVFTNLEFFGNTASTTHFIALYQLLKKGIFKPDDRILLLGPASGLILSLLIFKPLKLVEKYA
jgi:3-oxoacyl-[acyl-carrier-protein] synthase-3